jgi:hypothetical protein
MVLAFKPFLGSLVRASWREARRTKLNSCKNVYVRFTNATSVTYGKRRGIEINGEQLR